MTRAEAQTVIARLILRLAMFACILFLMAALPFTSSRAQTVHTRATTHVYLFRGFMNVFSLGMDELADKFTRRGMQAEVYNHVLWATAAADAVQAYKAGRATHIIVIGHSAGAAAVVAMVDALGEQGVPVALAVTLDGNSGEVDSDRVARFVNLYLSNGTGGVFKKGPKFRGTLTNTDLMKVPNIWHMNIDKLPNIQAMVMGYVSQAVGGGAVAKPTPAAETTGTAVVPAAAETTGTVVAPAAAATR